MEAWETIPAVPAITELMRESDDDSADAGRRERFEKLYRRHAGEVLAYALRRAAPEAAHDAAADTFLVAWRRLDTVPDNALPWLYAVTHKTLSTQRRSQRRRAALVEKLRGEQTEAQQTPPPADSPVLAVFRRLPERDREALMLTAWEELSSRDAAAALNCSPIAFRLRLHRARRRLTRELEAEQEGARSRRPDVPIRELN